MPIPGVGTGTPITRVSPDRSAPVRDLVPLIRPDQFRETIKSGDVVVEFFNFGCPYCKHAEPHLKKVAAELDGDVKFARMSLADPMAQHLAGQFGTTLLPGFALFSEGKFIGSFGRQGRDHVEADFIRANVTYAFDQ
jgi:thioredoxin-like negative regulator of GroEL